MKHILRYTWLRLHIVNFDAAQKKWQVMKNKTLEVDPSSLIDLTNYENIEGARVVIDDMWILHL